MFAKSFEFLDGLFIFSVFRLLCCETFPHILFSLYFEVRQGAAGHFLYHHTHEICFLTTIFNQNHPTPIAVPKTLHIFAAAEDNGQR